MKVSGKRALFESLKKKKKRTVEHERNGDTQSSQSLGKKTEGTGSQRKNRGQPDLSIVEIC